MLCQLTVYEQKEPPTHASRPTLDFLANGAQHGPNLTSPIRFPLRPSARPVVLIAVLFAISAAPATAVDTRVDVVVDMSAAGRKVTPPTPGHPTYYLPILGGYLQRGHAVAGEPPPPSPNQVALVIARTLAKQGYIVANRRDPPSIVLSLFCGQMNPIIIQSDVTDPGSKNFLNEAEEMSLVEGKTIKDLDLNSDRIAARQGTEEDRYFIMIMAYDYRYYTRTHRKLALWQAKMSAPAQGVSLEEMIPILAAAGGPQFGRETRRPLLIAAPLPEGRVIVGTPSVVRPSKPAGR